MVLTERRRRDYTRTDEKDLEYWSNGNRRKAQGARRREMIKTNLTP